MAIDLIVRFGPTPTDTENAAGELDASFTGCFVFQLEDGAVATGAASHTDSLVDTVRAVWRHLTAEGHGHMLIGKYSGFEYTADGAASCLSPAEKNAGVKYVPKGYTPLYAVARGNKRPGDGGPGDGGPDYVDIGIDYRGTQGPGDRSIRPVIFEAESPSGPPTVLSFTPPPSPVEF